MPTLITLLLCLGLQSLLGNTVSGRPTAGFGSIAFPNMLAVNASASASASASANISSTLAVGTTPNATAGTEIGSSGTLTMPGLTPPKTCVCQDSASSPLPVQGVPGTVSSNATSPVDSAPDTKASSSSPSSPSSPSESPTDLNATSPDAPADNSPNSSSATPSPSGAKNASAAPEPETPGAASTLLATDFSRASPLLMSIAVGLTLLYV